MRSFTRNAVLFLLGIACLIASIVLWGVVERLKSENDSLHHQVIVHQDAARLLEQSTSGVGMTAEVYEVSLQTGARKAAVGEVEVKSDDAPMARRALEAERRADILTERLRTAEQGVADAKNQLALVNANLAAEHKARQMTEIRATTTEKELSIERTTAATAAKAASGYDARLAEAEALTKRAKEETNDLRDQLASATDTNDKRRRLLAKSLETTSRERDEAAASQKTERDARFKAEARLGEAEKQLMVQRAECETDLAETKRTSENPCNETYTSTRTINYYTNPSVVAPRSPVIYRRTYPRPGRVTPLVNPLRMQSVRSRWSEDLVHTAESPPPCGSR